MQFSFALNCYKIFLEGFGILREKTNQKTIFYLPNAAMVK